jgi:hypothetical protein
MASFHTKTFIKWDDYQTPKYAWEDIQQYIPKDKVIWESFYGDGNSGKHLQNLGFDVIHNQDDFFTSNHGDIVVTNPPFSQKKEVFTRLKQLEKPFMIICPAPMIFSVYFRNLFRNEKIQIIVPKKRIQFIKTDENGNILTTENKCNFDCFYFCWKINLPKDIIFL